MCTTTFEIASRREDPATYMKLQKKILLKTRKQISSDVDIVTIILIPVPHVAQEQGEQRNVFVVALSKSENDINLEQRLICFCSCVFVCLSTDSAGRILVPEAY